MKELQQLKISDLILVNNHQFVVCNKPTGMGAQDDKTGDRSLFSLVQQFTKGTLYPVHRIDRPASGLILLAKKKPAVKLLSDGLQDGGITKIYIAATRNRPEAVSGELIDYLFHDTAKNKSFISSQEKKDAKEAKLKYEIIGKSDKYHFWAITLQTGRHHQIRAQLAALNCPIKGDVKYGDRRSNVGGGIHLHAWKLEMNDKMPHGPANYEAPFPNESLWNWLNTEILQQWQNSKEQK
jgi:23S rRNA pseudouridine1911/1915/1917 synthase